jgi:hypothetical protein
MPLVHCQDNKLVTIKLPKNTKQVQHLNVHIMALIGFRAHLLYRGAGGARRLGGPGGRRWWCEETPGSPMVDADLQKNASSHSAKKKGATGPAGGTLEMDVASWGGGFT